MRQGCRTGAFCHAPEAVLAGNFSCLTRTFTVVDTYERASFRFAWRHEDVMEAETALVH